MVAKKYIVELAAGERERLTGLISKGKAQAKTILKARILLKADAADNNTSFTKGLGQPCASPCLGRVHPVEREDTRQPLWRAGNTIFYEVPKNMAKAHLNGADMLVLQQRYGS